jgi:hypothetical protein
MPWRFCNASVPLPDALLEKRNASYGWKGRMGQAGNVAFLITMQRRDETAPHATLGNAGQRVGYVGAFCQRIWP